MFERLLGKDKPQGTVQDAWRLLQARKIDEARELLRRLIKHEKSNFEALVLGLYEIIRPPKDGPEAVRRAEALEALAPDSNEVRTMFVCGTWTNPSELTFKRYNEIWKSNPRCITGHALRVMAVMAMSDAEIQTTFKPGHALESVYVTPLIKGLASLELRMHDAAREQFERGARDPDSVAAMYEDRLKVRFLPEEKARLVARYRLLCESGFGLTLRDLGRGTEAKEKFRGLIGPESPLAGDLKALSEEA